MDEITVVCKGVRITLTNNGDCLLWADHEDESEDPDIAIRTADISEILDLVIHLGDPAED